jgi:hypothetical protein
MATDFYFFLLVSLPACVREPATKKCSLSIVIKNILLCRTASVAPTFHFPPSVIRLVKVGKQKVPPIQIMASSSLISGTGSNRSLMHIGLLVLAFLLSYASVEARPIVRSIKSTHGTSATIHL